MDHSLPGAGHFLVPQGVDSRVSEGEDQGMQSRDRCIQGDIVNANGWTEDDDDDHQVCDAAGGNLIPSL